MATSGWASRSLALLPAILLLSMVDPGPQEQARGHGRARPLQIVATTGMVGEMVRGIVGDRAAVTTLMGEGVDPHLYKVTVADVRALAAADVVVASGLMLEGRMGDVFPKLRRRGRVVIEAGGALGADELLFPEGAHAHPDPHLWMDPLAWSSCAAHVAKALGECDPDNAPYYAANVRTMTDQWKAVDSQVALAIASIPKKQRVLVTAHDAFSYFGRRYGIDVLGVQGISTESEAGLAGIRNLVGVLMERDVPAVFVETTVSDKSVRALVEGVAARGKHLEVGGSLYSDAMGKPGTPEGTYPGMLRANAMKITGALGGDTSSLVNPEKP